MVKNKKKIGLFALSCCEGCECVIFEHPKEFLKAMADVEIVEARLLEDADIVWERWDLAFVEGSAITAANLKILKKIRENSNILVTLGNCAEFGGVHKMKNYRGKEAMAKMLYKYPKTIDNLEIKDMKNLVKVDYNIPGCPITAHEFLHITYNLLNGRKPKIAERTVCFECQRRGFPCLLQKGEPCFGPISLGGCDAVCLASRMPCEACRGFYEGANFDSLLGLVDKRVGKKRREELLEIFGMKDRLEKIQNSPNSPKAK